MPSAVYLSSSAGEEQSSARELWKRDDDADGMTKARQALRASKPSSFDVAASKLGRSSSSPVRYPTMGSPHSLVPEGKQPFSVTNLWARFAQQRWKKVVKSSKADGRYVYLILENLAHGLTLPHILDLKMGTQQHSPHESAAKQKRKSSRCAATTSASCGMRISGIQLYSKAAKRNMLKDKYWGRSLSVLGLTRALQEFMSDGDRLRIEIVESLLQKITKLIEAVSKTPMRFYGSSLLVIYDGHTSKVASSSSSSAENTKPGVRDIVDSLQVKLIDFAQFMEAKEDSGPDTGLLFGLRSLHRIYSDILKQEKKEMLSAAEQGQQGIRRMRSESDPLASFISKRKRTTILGARGR